MKLEATVTNHGPSNVSGTTVKFVVPEGMEVLTESGAISDGWSNESGAVNTAGTTSVTVSRTEDDELGVGRAFPTILVSAKVHKQAVPHLTYSVSVAGLEEDSNQENNAASATVEVAPVVPLTLLRPATPTPKPTQTDQEESRWRLLLKSLLILGRHELVGAYLPPQSS